MEREGGRRMMKDEDKDDDKFGDMGVGNMGEKEGQGIPVWCTDGLVRQCKEEWLLDYKQSLLQSLTATQYNSCYYL